MTINNKKSVIFAAENNNKLTNQTNITDDFLIAELRQSSSKAIDLLYAKYSGALYGVVLKIVHSEELAEEIIQDVFVKIWKSIDKYDATKGRFFTWILNIARNTAIDYTRLKSFSQKKQNIDDVEFSLNNNDNISINPDTIGLRDMITKMPEDYRILIDAVYYQGFTQAEVSENLQIPLGTVKTRLRTAILQLRQKFDA
jgi:RNA polymerase sigma factor (sigma-70 family)